MICINDEVRSLRNISNCVLYFIPLRALADGMVTVFRTQK